MIIDVTGTPLITGNGGKDCPGNGENPNYECCCDECDHMLDCFEEYGRNFGKKKPPLEGRWQPQADGEVKK